MVAKGLWEFVKPRSEFARHVLTLATGTGMAQVLPLAVLPVLSRLYTEVQFGLLNLFLSIVSILGIVATGRYELAIMLPEENEEAAQVLGLSIGLSVLLSLLLLVLVTVFNAQICALLGSEEIGPWLYLVPVLLVANAVYQSFNYWFNRRKQYQRLAKNRVLRSGLTEVGKVALGFQKLTAGGLILGTVIGQAVVTVLFLRIGKREDGELFAKIDRAGMMRAARRYRNFPLFTVPAEAINDISKRMPVFVLTSAFGKAATGQFGMAQMVLGGPIGILGGAVADVFKQQASEQFNREGNCRALWISTFRRLLLLGVPLFAVLYWVAPVAFAFVLGEKWRLAGEMARALTPMYFMSLLAGPLSRTLYIAEKQKLDLAWQIAFFGAVGTALYWGQSQGDVLVTMHAFGLAGAAMYAIFLWMSYRAAQGS